MSGLDYCYTHRHGVKKRTRKMSSREIVRLHYEERKTHKEIAAMAGISRGRVQQICRLP